MRKDWSRWLFASLSKHFYDNRGGVKMYIQGQQRDPDSDSKELFEFRTQGPNFTHLSANIWEVHILVNILIQATQTNNNIHRMHELVGLMFDAFKDNISVYKYGNNTQDDGSLFGCLQLLQEPDREKIKIMHFGQLRQDVNLVHGTIEGTYRMDIEV